MIQKIELTDGSIIQVDVPDDISEENLDKVIKQEIEIYKQERMQAMPEREKRIREQLATTPDPQQQLVQEVRQPEQRQPWYTKLMGEVPQDQPLPGQRLPVEEAGNIAFGKGLMNLARGIGIADMPEETEKKAYQALEEKYPVVTAGMEVAGEAAPGMVVPLGTLGSFAKVVAATGLGAIESLIAARGRGETEGTMREEAMISGAASGVFEASPPVMRLASKITRRALGRTAKGALIDATGKATPEFQKALDKLGLSFEEFSEGARELIQKSAGLDPEEIARKAFLEQEGFAKEAAITGTQLRPTVQRRALEKKLKDPDLLAQYEVQNKLIKNKFNKLIDKTKGVNFEEVDAFVDEGILNKAYTSSDLKGLKKYLEAGGAFEGEEMWQAMRRRTLEHIRDKALKGPMDDIGQRVITLKGMTEGLQDLGINKLKTLFSKEEIEGLKRIRQIAKVLETPAKDITPKRKQWLVKETKRLEKYLSKSKIMRMLFNLKYNEAKHVLNAIPTQTIDYITETMIGRPVAARTAPRLMEDEETQ